MLDGNQSHVGSDEETADILTAANLLEEVCESLLRI
jgi:hypothetical protein